MCVSGLPLAFALLATFLFSAVSPRGALAQQHLDDSSAPYDNLTCRATSDLMQWQCNGCCCCPVSWAAGSAKVRLFLAALFVELLLVGSPASGTG